MLAGWRPRRSAVGEGANDAEADATNVQTCQRLLERARDLFVRRLGGTWYLPQEELGCLGKGLMSVVDTKPVTQDNITAGIFE
jgi:hypothetical protein